MMRDQFPTYPSLKHVTRLITPDLRLSLVMGASGWELKQGK